MNGQHNNKYVGMRYIPLYKGEWDNTQKYEPLVVVTYQGASYTSRTFVPIGADITDKNFWFCSGNYNAQIEAYRQEVEQLKLSEVFYNIAQLSPIGDITDVLQKLVNEKRNIFIPNGQYTIDGDVLVPEGRRIISNGATLIGQGKISFQADSFIEGINFSGVGNDTFCVLYKADNTEIKNCNFENSVTGLYAQTCNHSYINHCTFSNNTRSDFYGTQCSGCVIEHCRCTSSTINHNIQFTKGNNNNILNNYCANASEFGCNMYLENNGVIRGNKTFNTSKEGINVQDSQHIIITENSCMWDTGKSTDFGISIYGSDATKSLFCNHCIVANNDITKCGKSGIAIAENCFNCIAESNIINNCNSIPSNQPYALVMFNGCIGCKFADNNVYLEDVSNITYEIYAYGVTRASITGNTFNVPIRTKVDSSCVSTFRNNEPIQDMESFTFETDVTAKDFRIKADYSGADDLKHICGVFTVTNATTVDAFNIIFGQLRLYDFTICNQSNGQNVRWAYDSSGKIKVFVSVDTNDTVLSISGYFKK